MANTEWQAFTTFLDTLRGATEPRPVVEALLQGLASLLRVARGIVLLTQPDGSLVPVVTHLSGSSQDRDDEELASVSQTIARRVMTTGEVVFANGAVDDAWFAQASAFSKALLPRRIVCAPLTTGDRTIGVVYLDGRPGSGIDADALPFVTSVCGLAGALIGAARTRAALLEERTRMARLNELHLGSERMVVGTGPASQTLEGLVDAAAAQDVTVLITGETGTGKELVARELHRRSPRRNGPFVPVNCAALALDVIESELFGVLKGAYTGANESRPGHFEVASGGTIFLDEIGELAPSIQVKLLRVLQERVITRLGDTKPIKVDVRLVCATNRDLAAEVAAGTFRQDMYFRINVFPIEVPPLRSRIEDIDVLADIFLAKLGQRCGKRLQGFSATARRKLRSHAWPGNIRELRNVVERSIIMAVGPTIEPDDLLLSPTQSAASAYGAPAGDDSLRALVSQLPPRYEEMRDLVDHLFFETGIVRCNGNVSQFIREAEISRNTLYRRMNKLGMTVGRPEDADQN